MAFSTIPSQWDIKTCMHGIKEGLDSHSCSDCQAIAHQMGYDLSGQDTYLFEKMPRNLKRKKHG